MQLERFVFMNGKDFSEVVNLIVRKDPRYDKSAYQFVREALDYTVKSRKDAAQKGVPVSGHHVSGQDLCRGARDYALAQYGPLAATLLRHWGVTRTEDFGQIVFNLVELEVFGAREEDSQADFAGVFDFHEAFEAPFLPSSRREDAASSPSPGKAAE